MTSQWRDSNGQPYLYVEADNRFDLGVAVGKGLYKQIVGTHSLIEGLLKKMEGTPAGKMINKSYFDQLAKGYSSFIPDVDMEEIKGMHKGLLEVTNEKISFEDILLQSVLINVLYQFMSKLPPEAKLEGCTNFGVINPDGSVIHGQNYDADGRMASMNAFVHHKLKGEPEAFLYRTGADLGTATGKNEAGVCMTVSVLQSTEVADVMTPRGVLVRNIMREETALAAMKKSVDEQGRSPFSYNLVLSDQQVVVASQSIPSEQRITVVKRQIVQSNQYDYVDWIQYLTKPSYSKKRQIFSENLLGDFYSRYGCVTNEDLLEILREKPMVCRTAPDDGIGTTVLFFTRESFGHGNPADNPIGQLPF